MTTKLNISLFFAFLIILSLNYCIKNDEIAPYNEADLFDCYQQQSWDSTRIVKSLLGQWRWDSIKCPVIVTKSKGEVDYRLNFVSDSKLEIYQSDILTKTVNWFINGHDGIYNIHTEPSVDKVFGAVFICGDQMVFYNSWLDGCDYYYTKFNDKNSI